MERNNSSRPVYNRPGEFIMADRKVKDITMEAGVYLNEDNIHLYVYLGEDTSDPVFENDISYEECVEEFFEMITVRGNQIKDKEVQLAHSFINKLEQMAKYARNTLDDLECI